MLDIIRELDEIIDGAIGTRDAALEDVLIACRNGDSELAADALAVANEAQATYDEVHPARYNLNNRLVALVTGCPQAPSI